MSYTASPTIPLDASRRRASPPTGLAGVASGARAAPDRIETERRPRRDPYRYFLVLRFALLNVVAAGLLGAAYLEGLVEMVLTADRTNLTILIFLVFVVGFALCARRVWQTSDELDSVRRFRLGYGMSRRKHGFFRVLSGEDADSRANLTDALRLELAHRISGVRYIANSLVLLGLVGTVVGFIIALSGVDAAGASDVATLGPMVSTLIAGMSTALYTTLVGAVLNIWLMVNYQLLSGGTVKLISALVEIGESDARARAIRR